MSSDGIERRHTPIYPRKKSLTFYSVKGLLVSLFFFFSLHQTVLSANETVTGELPVLGLKTYPAAFPALGGEEGDEHVDRLKIIMNGI